MERRFFLMIGALLGVALILATAATTVYTQSAFAIKGGNGNTGSHSGGNGGHLGGGNGGGNGGCKITPTTNCTA